MKLLSKLALAFFAVALIFVACTTDDDVIEGKACDINKPLNERCIVGYTCQCPGGDLQNCTCTRTKTSGLRQSPIGERATTPRISPAKARRSVSRRYLERRYPQLDLSASESR